MSLVDDKYRQNKQDYEIGQVQIGWLQAELESLGSDQAERRAYITQSIQKMKEIYNESQIQIEAKEWGQQVSTRSNESYGQVCYGEVKTGGHITFMTADEGDNGNFIHLYITFTCHEIDGFQNVFIDGKQVTFSIALYPNNALWATGDFNNLIYVSAKSLGTTGQTANSNLVSQSALLFPNKWTSYHRQRGCAGIYMIMMYDFQAFPNGLPEITAQLKGKNDIYDPRTGLTGWSNNSALCLANYLTDSYIGLGHSWDEIDEESLIIAADVCDELITLKDLTTEKRYTTNGVFSATKSNTAKTIKEQLEITMSGAANWAGDRWYFKAGKSSEPVLALTESDIRSEIKVRARPENGSEIFNAVGGQYRGDLTLWEWADYPPVTNSTYQYQDGERIQRDQSYSFISSQSQAQRVSKILLEESRQWIDVEFNCSPKILKAVAGDNVTLSADWLGWSNKVFRLESVAIPGIGETGKGICELPILLRETASGVFDWANGEETKLDLAANTQLPDPSRLPTPTGLTLSSGTAELDIRSDGTIFARLRVSWNATTNPYITTGGSFRVQYKKSSDSEYREAGLIDGSLNNLWVLDVKDGQAYDVRVRAETVGGKSAWASVLTYVVNGKLEKPSAPSSLAATMDRRGITLSWSGVSDLDLSGYEIRSGAVFSSGTYINLTSSTSYLIETQAAGEHLYSLAAKDTSGIYSDPLSISVVIQAPSEVRSLRGLVLNNMVQLVWLEPSSYSFPIKEYQIRKGNAFSTAEILGSVTATIKNLQEFIPGAYTYWVAAVDEYGNIGEEASVALYVDAPPLFELLFEQVIDFTSYTTMTNLYASGSKLYGSVDLTETFQSHFTSRGWTYPQDQITAGYLLYAQPANSSNAVYEQVIDFGSTIEAVLINFYYLADWIDGDGSVSPRVSYSADSISWTDGAEGVRQILGFNFRYVKIRLTIDGDDDKSLARISEARVRLEIKKTSESGLTAAVSTDGSGTLVVFERDFLDIFEGSFKPSYQGSSAYYPSYTVSGNRVRVYLWNVSGARVSGNVSWSVEGIVSTY